MFKGRSDLGYKAGGDAESNFWDFALVGVSDLRCLPQGFKCACSCKQLAAQI